jgi:stage V sporulation protein B
VAAAENKIAKRAGIGGVAVLGAKVFFILSGFMQNALLPRFIGRPAYGALALVLAPANIVNNVVVAGSTQSASRAVAGAPGNEDAAQRAAMRVHVPLAIAAGLLFALAAVPISRFEHTPYIAAPLMAMSAVVLFYGLYAPLVGVLNGRGLFVRQAMLDALFATMRTAGLLGVGWLFLRAGRSGALGSTVGFALAALAIATVASLMVRVRVRVRTLPAKTPTTANVLAGARYLAVFGPLAVAQFFTNALMQVDIILLGRYLHEGGPANAADEWVAAYRACQLFAFLPYQLLFSVTQILFPMVARAKAQGDADAVRAYVARGARIGAIACGVMVAVIAGQPRAMLAFAFSADVADRGADALRLLALGQGAFALLAIATTVLVSLGRERSAAMITLGALVLVTGACAVLVPGRAFGAAQLQLTAIATGSGLAIALVIAAALVVREAGAFVPWATAVRVSLALAASIACGAMLPHVGRVLTLALAATVALLYVVLLLVTREIGSADLRLVTDLIGRKRAK